MTAERLDNSDTDFPEGTEKLGGGKFRLPEQFGGKVVSIVNGSMIEHEDPIEAPYPQGQESPFINFQLILDGKLTPSDVARTLGSFTSMQSGARATEAPTIPYYPQQAEPAASRASNPSVSYLNNVNDFDDDDEFDDEPVKPMPVRNSNAERRAQQAAALEEELEQHRKRRRRAIKFISLSALTLTAAVTGGPIIQAATSGESAAKACVNFANVPCVLGEFNGELFNPGNIGHFIPEDN